MEYTYLELSCTEYFQKQRAKSYMESSTHKVFIKQSRDDSNFSESKVCVRPPIKSVFEKLHNVFFVLFYIFNLERDGVQFKKKLQIFRTIFFSRIWQSSIL